MPGLLKVYVGLKAVEVWPLSSKSQRNWFPVLLFIKVNVYGAHPESPGLAIAVAKFISSKSILKTPTSQLVDWVVEYALGVVINWDPDPEHTPWYIFPDGSKRLVPPSTWSAAA